MSIQPPTATPKPWWKRRGPVVLGLAAACAGGVLFARLSMPAPGDDTGPSPARVTPATAVTKLPIRDSDQVIGVTLGSKHRAYLLADLFRPERHVLNDMFEDVPVTVTFCDLDNCVKAYTSSSRGKPLDMKNGGPHPTKSRKMVLDVGGRKFEHDTGKPLDGDTQKPFPYQDVSAVRTTWGEWLAEHPDTELRAEHRHFPSSKK